MAYHMPTGQVVLFGGSNGSTIFGDTWEWDGNNWSQATPSHVPPGRLYFSMCDDVGSGRVWMFGGRPSYTNDTWEWDGTDWTQRQPVAAPSGRAASGMAYDSVNGGPVLFGGITLGCLGDTWTFQGPTASFDGFGSGCPGSVGVPDLRADAPWLGSSWSLELDNVPTTTFAVFTGGLSNTVWNGQPLPLSLAPSGLPGCNLYVRPDTSALLPVTNGSTTLTLSIPNSPSLEGVAVYFQALVFDPGVNAAGAVGSNAGTATIAGR